MTNEEIDALVQQLKSITNCLYGGVSADADSVYQRLDKLSRLGKVGAAVEAKWKEYGNSSQSELEYESTVEAIISLVASKP